MGNVKIKGMVTVIASVFQILLGCGLIYVSFRLEQNPDITFGSQVIFVLLIFMVGIVAIISGLGNIYRQIKD